jgi:DNA-binding transcriptional regulator GbsR (MarR family)
MTIHYIYLYFKNNLTIPKTKDLIKKPNEYYKDIYSDIQKKNNKEDMKQELKDYLKNLSSKNGTNKKDNKQTDVPIIKSDISSFSNNELTQF